MLTNHKGVRALLNHQHGGGVLENMRVLKGLAESSLTRDGFEKFVDGHAVQLCGLLRVEDEIVGIGLATIKPRFECSSFVEQRVAFDLEQRLRGIKRALQAGDVNLLGQLVQDFGGKPLAPVAAPPPTAPSTPASP